MFNVRFHVIFKLLPNAQSGSNQSETWFNITASDPAYKKHILFKTQLTDRCMSSSSIVKDSFIFLNTHSKVFYASLIRGFLVKFDEHI